MTIRSRLAAAICALLALTGLALAEEEERPPFLRAVDALIEHAAARPIAYHIVARLDRDPLALSCTTQLTIETTRQADRLPLLLHPNLHVAAAVVDGEKTKVERSGDLLWVDLPAPARAGRRFSVEVQYAGRLPEELAFREGQDLWVELSPHAFWYPWVQWTWDLSSVATFAVECRLPEGMMAVSNLPGSSRHGRWRGRSTRPCYDVALFAGPYISTAHSRAGVRGYARPDMAERLPALVAEAGAIVSYCSACYGNAPEGTRNLVIPPQSISGNWGREGLVVAALMRPDDPMQNSAILSHELGHSWWGLAVRFDNRADLWLAEGLTEFSASRARFHLEGEEVTRARLATTMRDYRLARETGIALVACRQESPYSENLREDGGTVFLTQLRLHLGAADFDRRLRRFYQEHIGATATTADFIRVMTSGARPGTEAFVHGWITNPLPEVTPGDVLAGLR